MTPEELQSLDILIERGFSFAICQTPESRTPRFFLQQNGNPEILRGIAELNGRSGFVIAPFHPIHPAPDMPILLLTGGQTAIPLPSGIKDTPPPSIGVSPQAEDQAPSPPCYESRFNLFMEALRDNRFDKLVLSRSVTLERHRGFSPANAFNTACSKYPGSFVYLCHTPQTGTWLGSSPEMLLSGSNGSWRTVALAGTRTTGNTSPASWDEKNREEQAIVSRYVKTQLASIGIHSEETKPATIQSGGVKHLKTEFTFSLADHSHLGQLLELLHPTPAVSGLPKEESVRFILENEGYDRRYYSGFIGVIDPAGQSDIYVNLRCMSITPSHITLYAGGGLLPLSDMEEERQELNDKLQTMMALVETKHHVFQ